MLRLCNDLSEQSDLDEGSIWFSAEKGLTSTGLRWKEEPEENTCGNGEQRLQFWRVSLYQDDIPHCCMLVVNPALKASNLLKPFSFDALNTGYSCTTTGNTVGDEPGLVTL